MVLLAAMLFVSCDNKTKEPETKTYAIGDVGPAGGWIFYDCDADNDSGNADGLTSATCGWRYLEIANEKEGIGEYCFGYYKTSSGYTTVGTSDAIGKGKENTEKLLVMGNADKKAESGKESDEMEEYAAQKCRDYNGGGYTDWFLPSIKELQAYFNSAVKDKLDYYKIFISSTEIDSDKANDLNYDGEISYSYRSSKKTVIPVRSFK